MTRVEKVLSLVIKSGFIEDTTSLPIIRNIYPSGPRGKTSLMYAAYTGNIQYLTYLLNNNVDPNVTCIKDSVGQCSTALMYATSMGHLSCVRKLLQCKASPNIGRISDNCTPLMWAITKNHLDIMIELLSYNADFNAIRKNGISALMIASELGHLDIVKYLLTLQYLKVNLKTFDMGMTALHYACQSGHLEIVDELIGNYDTDISDTESEGFTPLIIAVQENHLLIARSLLMKGANVHIKDSYGKTALTYATENANYDIVRELILYGAKDDDNLTSLITGYENDSNEIVNLLINYLPIDSKKMIVGEWLDNKKKDSKKKDSKKTSKKISKTKTAFS